MRGGPDSPYLCSNANSECIFLDGAPGEPHLCVSAASAFADSISQCAGLFTVCDLFPFHLQARKVISWYCLCSLAHFDISSRQLNLWTMVRAPAISVASQLGRR